MPIQPKQCYLRGVDDPFRIIDLSDRKVTVIGRNARTGINDTYVSRNHLECIADYASETVTVKTNGQSYSGCNGFALTKKGVYQFRHGDRLEVRLGFHRFDIVFEPNNTPSPPPKRRRQEMTDWEELDSRQLLIYTPEGCQARSCIASFDLDGTLIKTKSGNRFPKNFDDWMLAFPQVVQKLRRLYEDDYKLVIFTNQMKIGKNPSQIPQYKKKIEDIIEKLDLPVQVFVSTGASIYRKPLPGMWDVLRSVKNEDVEIDMERSFFVGDAAGRPKNWAPKKNKDHSMCDRLFALNLDLKFLTPEEYFLGANKVRYDMPDFDPRNLTDDVRLDLKLNEQEVILMVGFQGAGKTEFCKAHLLPKGFVHISRDRLKTWQKCVAELKSALEKNKCAVVDNTNIDKESRKRFIDVCTNKKVKCRCFVMTTNFKHCLHNNKFRELTDKSHEKIGDVLIASVKNNYEEPTIDEGFDEILNIPFIPKFRNIQLEKLYRMFLLES